MTSRIGPMLSTPAVPEAVMQTGGNRASLTKVVLEFADALAATVASETG
jgi:hypothetical protein